MFSIFAVKVILMLSLMNLGKDSSGTAVGNWPWEDLDLIVAFPCFSNTPALLHTWIGFANASLRFMNSGCGVCARLFLFNQEIR